MAIIVRELKDEAVIDFSAELIRKSFETVARDFNLTKENCPTHASLITNKQLHDLYEKGQWFFGIFVNGHQTGFVAVEKSNPDIFFMEKLAVLPEARHHGYGKILVRFAVEFAHSRGALKLSIGTIHEHQVLKDWYKALGFVETGLRKFAHLPFTVCFMEKVLK